MPCRGTIGSSLRAFSSSDSASCRRWSEFSETSAVPRMASMMEAETSALQRYSGSVNPRLQVSAAFANEQRERAPISGGAPGREGPGSTLILE
jgi:hypothetical protein